MLKEYARHYYGEGGCNCAEAVLMAANDEYHLCLPADSLKLIGGFGGGLGCGSTCGALCGAIAAYGALRMGERERTSPGFRAGCAALVKKFEALMGDTDCSVVRPQKATPELKCMKVVEAACDALESQLAESAK